MTPGPYHVGTGERSTPSEVWNPVRVVEGPGLHLELSGENGKDMETFAAWVADHMNLAFKAGKDSATQ